MYRNQRHLSFVIFFVFGFIFDSLTLKRIDQLYDIVVLATYLVVTALCIIVLHAIDESRPRFLAWLHFILQFAFGGLFSAFMIFYSRSGTLIGSWPFLIFITLLFFGNELLKKRYEELVYRIAVFFTVLFSYVIFTLPLVVHRIGQDVFIWSGIVSLLITTILIFILSAISLKKVKDGLIGIIISILGIFAFYNIAYFTNSIPPVPLSLKNIGVYHFIEKQPNGNYAAVGEPVSFLVHELNLTETFHATSSNVAERTAYVFSSVFAPTVISTPIKHVWEYYSENQKKWIMRGTVSFPIIGGRDGGYRGYSFISDIEPGKWRVSVMTSDNFLIGQKRFDVIDTSVDGVGRDGLEIRSFDL